VHLALADASSLGPIFLWRGHVGERGLRDGHGLRSLGDRLGLIR
jgi:hypothetical protein